MRILLLAQFYAPVIGGEERHVISLAKALVSRGHDVTVVTLSHPDRPEIMVDGGAIVRSIRGTTQRGTALFSEGERRHAPPFPDPELGFALRKIMSDFEPDIVHAHNWLLHSYLPLSRKSKMGFVVTLHDYSLVCARKKMMFAGEPCEGPSMRRCIPCAAEQYGLFVGTATVLGNMASSTFERRAVSKFIAVSREVATRSNLEMAGLQYDVIPTFIGDDLGDTPVPDARTNDLPANEFILFVGDLTRDKGIEVLLKAYDLLEKAPPLVMIGRRCADTPNDLPPGVMIFESWPHNAIMSAWRRCLFGLAPSIWPEACGTVVMEANAVGRPMIASDIGGLSDLVESEVTGLLIAPGDIQALAHAMKRFVEDPAAREHMASKCISKSQTFMAKAIVPRIEKIYSEVAPYPAPLHAASANIGVRI